MRKDIPVTKLILSAISILVIAWAMGVDRETLAFAGILLTLIGHIFIYNQNFAIMATIEQFEAALGRIDAATTRIAGDIRDLKDQIANQGLPGDVEATVLAALEAKATALEAIGKDVENPVPDESQPG